TPLMLAIVVASVTPTMPYTPTPTATRSSNTRSTASGGTRPTLIGSQRVDAFGSTGDSRGGIAGNPASTSVVWSRTRLVTTNAITCKRSAGASGNTSERWMTVPADGWYEMVNAPASIAITTRPSDGAKATPSVTCTLS